ncbi:hypothetical protein KC19_N013500 [Ceratodon purpureus]|nr:hypothetical protein KC19_N013500 [Ceratodon purpureus]
MSGEIDLSLLLDSGPLFTNSSMNVFTSSGNSSWGQWPASRYFTETLVQSACNISGLLAFFCKGSCFPCTRISGMKVNNQNNTVHHMSKIIIANFA